MTPLRDILDSVGETPLVLLNKCFARYLFPVYAKVEGMNPGGSAKDRPAYAMIQHALASGAVTVGGTVVESSSGNMAIGLAQACCRLGLRLVCVVDPKTTAQNIGILRAYGAEVVMVTEPDPDTGEFLPARLVKVRELVADRPGSFWPNQYANKNNARAHQETMREIADALDRRVDVLVCPTSTCGMLRGCAEYVGEHGLGTRLVAVDAVGSVIFGGERQQRLLPGHGCAIRPALADGLKVERVVYVSDADCVAGCRHLVRTEGILAGASSGGAISAVAKISAEISSGANCVVILPDRGERYVETVYSDAWVRKHFGRIPTMEAL